jgi:hypothetical protein
MNRIAMLQYLEIIPQVQTPTGIYYSVHSVYVLYWIQNLFRPHPQKKHKNLPSTG